MEKNEPMENKGGKTLTVNMNNYTIKCDDLVYKVSYMFYSSTYMIVGCKISHYPNQERDKGRLSLVVE